MRHFLLDKLAPPRLAVARLPSCVQATGSSSEPIARRCTALRLASLQRPAHAAQPPAAVAPLAEPKLQTTPITERKSVLGRRQGAPRCRFLDMELEP